LKNVAEEIFLIIPSIDTSTIFTDTQDAPTSALDYFYTLSELMIKTADPALRKRILQQWSTTQDPILQFLMYQYLKELLSEEKQQTWRESFLNSKLLLAPFTIYELINHKISFQIDTKWGESWIYNQLNIRKYPIANNTDRIYYSALPLNNGFYNEINSVKTVRYQKQTYLIYQFRHHQSSYSTPWYSAICGPIHQKTTAENLHTPCTVLAEIDAWSFEEHITRILAESP